ncbi:MULTISPECIES: ABC transporter permease [unclassified Streptosporangium]|uniref:ABC transporter permease n=1 Tax=unclassified Streptosporangium TaxID=2632669 RepID=UPI002E292466|nr:MULTISPECIES: hypothetical protein [unclassified Streptosporangium]
MSGPFAATGAMRGRLTGTGAPIPVSGEVAGAGALVRLILRRDRLLLPIWLVAVPLIVLAMAAGVADLYPTQEALRQYAEIATLNPAQRALRGPIYAATAGGITAWSAGMSSAILTGVASILLVIRHTRVEEETGRRELLGSTVVGRHAPLVAALAVTLSANLLAAALIIVALVSAGLPAAGAAVLGLSAAGFGWVCAGAAAVAAQLTRGASAARGIAFAGLGLAFLVRAMGDLLSVPSDAGEDLPGNRPAGGETGGAAWLPWLSPLGWVRLTRAFAGERWWILPLFAVLTVLLVGAAHALSARRDLAAGLLPSRPGPAVAAPGLRGALSIAWRVNRGTLLAWTAGCAVLGVAFGGGARGAQDQLGDLFPGVNGTDALFTFSTMVFSQVIACYAILTMLRPQAEERGGLAEIILATAVGRVRWVGAHLFFALAGPALMVSVLGLAAGLTYGLGTGDVANEFPRVLGATLLWIPAVWVLTGITLALYGLLPRLAAAVSWTFLAVFLVLELVVEFGQASADVMIFSPFAHIPKILLGVGFSVVPLLALSALAALLAVAGLLGLRRRDIT